MLLRERDQLLRVGETEDLARRCRSARSSGWRRPAAMPARRTGRCRPRCRQPGAAAAARSGPVRSGRPCCGRRASARRSPSSSPLTPASGTFAASIELSTASPSAVSPDGPTGRVSQTLTGLPSAACWVRHGGDGLRHGVCSPPASDATDPSMSRSIVGQPSSGRRRTGRRRSAAVTSVQPMLSSEFAAPPNDTVTVAAELPRAGRPGGRGRVLVRRAAAIEYAPPQLGSHGASRCADHEGQHRRCGVPMAGVLERVLSGWRSRRRTARTRTVGHRRAGIGRFLLTVKPTHQPEIAAGDHGDDQEHPEPGQVPPAARRSRVAAVGSRPIGGARVGGWRSVGWHIGGAHSTTMRSSLFRSPSRS